MSDFEKTAPSSCMHRRRYLCAGYRAGARGHGRALSFARAHCRQPRYLCTLTSLPRQARSHGDDRILLHVFRDHPFAAFSLTQSCRKRPLLIERDSVTDRALNRHMYYIHARACRQAGSQARTHARTDVCVVLTGSTIFSIWKFISFFYLHDARGVCRTWTRILHVMNCVPVRWLDFSMCTNPRRWETEKRSVAR